MFPIRSEEGQTRVRFDGVVNGPVRRVELPVAKDRPWTIVILDEGAPEPQVGHLKYHWNYAKDAFIRHWEGVGLLPEQLSAAKLLRLLRRYAGEEPRPFLYRPGGGAERPAQTLDWPEAERLDVLLGLAAFARDDARAAHLAKLYGALPKRWMVLGDDFAEGGGVALRGRLARLEAEAKAAAG